MTTSASENRMRLAWSPTVDRRRLGHARHHDAKDALHLRHSLAQRLALTLEGVAAAVAVDDLLDLAEQRHHGLAVVAGDLAEDQVERLDVGRALIERVDLLVTNVLLDREVLVYSRRRRRPAEPVQKLVALL